MCRGAHHASTEAQKTMPVENARRGDGAVTVSERWIHTVPARASLARFRW
jgi:hypothetical protein